MTGPWLRDLLCALLLALISIQTAQAQTPIDTYMDGSSHKGLMLQQKLAQSLPLGSTSFLTTHNSYNSRYYATLFRYWDPNHLISVAEQLDEGIRALEYDVHWSYDISGHKTLKLCHATDQHLLCSLFDRSFRDGLLELGSWLRRPEHLHEVVLLYVEEHMDGHYDEAVQALNDTVGDLVYRPGGCQALPMNISQDDVLRAGKQILIMGADNCENAGWNQLVYHYQYPTDNDTFEPFPACRTARFDTDFIQHNLTRIYEDKTMISALVGDAPQPITPQIMAEGMACGLSNIGMDKLKIADPRLEAARWSWADGQPDGSGDCVALDTSGRYRAANCNVTYVAACKQMDGAEWRVTNAAVSPATANAECQAEWGSDYRFDVPRNGYQHTQLQQQLLDRVEPVWLNLQRDSTGDYVSSYSTQVTLPPRDPASGQLRNGQGLCLRVRGEVAAGATLQQFHCQDSKTQMWERLRDGRIRSQANTDLCIGTANGMLKDYQPLSLQECTGSAALHWTDGNNLSLRAQQTPSLSLHIAFSILGINMPAVLRHFGGGPGEAWMLAN